MQDPLFTKVQIDGVEIFDLSLNPENANAKGYEYMSDINYELFAFNNSLNDSLELIYKNGHKFGTPKRNYNFATFYGIYAPIRK